MTPVDLQHVSGGDLEPAPFLSLGRGARCLSEIVGTLPGPLWDPQFQGIKWGSDRRWWDQNQMVGETAEETQAFQPRSPDGENYLPQHSPGEGLAPHLTPKGL